MAAAIVIVIVAIGLFATGHSKAATKSAPPPPPEVGVIHVKGEDVATYREYPARTYARDLVEVRGRVDGYVDRRTFDIGSDVRAGQVLYVLDVRPYEAEVERAHGALAQATADIAQAEAALSKARQDVDRLEPLVKEEAAPKQDLDNAIAARQAGDAAVAARKATMEANRAMVRTAELNLEYATIRAPISGRAGDSLLQVGGLVTKTSAQPLTTIVPLDPVWVRFQVSESELPFFQGPDIGAVPIELVLGNGTVHPHQGHIVNTLNSVNTKTGTMEVQAMFGNPDHSVLPGQFGRVRVRTAERTQALLVPQKAVQEVQGQQSVLTLGPDNTVALRSVVTGDRVDQRWIVEQGLKPGEPVIVEGLQKVRPGARVTPRPYTDRTLPAIGR
ncbi:MAG TPA: efflux RND transporter periplasmic adaptor subunit [Vicinamibacterales bacterium]|jgi:membrane fusion protein (multidrug efflux system)|nr:efflux RND transporter periplasmic adaptor subunit [Vicinamibacterales bacterium]